MCDRIIMPDGIEITSITEDPDNCLCTQTQDDILIWIIQNLSKATTPLKINDVLRIERDPFGYLVMIEKITNRCYYAGRFDEANEDYNLINGEDEE